ncbi:unnamed protein product [Blepharisma stoltei]|uniref:Uncharacterized protein n=1 Tax=Blepharisma stoltei TaxID=1481888 RepID=A0AAU9JZ82_9CILI|nr:unnamed protein product [Blepharisma stoltei]
METNKQARICGGIILSLAMMYYGYQVYDYSISWYEMEKLKNATVCFEVDILESWLISHNIIWLLALSLLLLILIIPEIQALFLCFLYILGPLYLSWSLVATVYYGLFMACCREIRDRCVNFYPFQDPPGFIALITVSIIFSSLLTIYLLSILLENLLSYFRERFQQYSHLL